MMKEKTNPKSVAPRKVKGTVLFTVVCVMLVLIVFLMGALALSVTANKRAMKNFNEAQTQATAKAGVNSMISALRNDVAIATAINELGTNEKFLTDPDVINAETGMPYEDISVEFFNGSNEVTNMGRITRAKIENVGTKIVVEDGKLTEKAVICFSATAKQGDAESTVSMYMLRGITSSPKTTPPKAVGFASTGGTLASNHTNVYGGSYVGFYDSSSTVNFDLGNDNLFEAPLAINGNMSFGSNHGSGKVDIIANPGTGIAVYGNLTWNNDSNEIRFIGSNATPTAMSGMSYKDIPYIYVQGEFQLGNYTINYKDNKPIVPLNVFCGSLYTVTANNPNICADIYCYDADKTSYIGKSGKGQSMTLYRWAADIIECDKSSAETHTAGNFYTMGSLSFDGQQGESSIQGKLFVAKDLTLNTPLKVAGDVYVGGVLKANKDLKVEGGHVFLAPGASIDPGTSANVKNKDGAQITGTAMSADDFAKVFPKEYKKDVILGLKTPDGNDTTKYESPGHPKKDSAGHILRDDTYQIVETVDDIINFKIQPSQYIYDYPREAAGKTVEEKAKNKVIEDAIKDNVYNNPGTVTITTHCTLKGTTQGGAVIKFQPATSEDLWVRVENFSLYNGARILFDDSKGGKLNLVLFGDMSNNTAPANKLVISTTTIDGLFASTTSTGFQINTGVGPTIPNVDILKPIPINIYSEKDVIHKLQLQNTCCIVANVKAPFLKYDTSSGCENFTGLAKSSSFKVYYDGVDLSTLPDHAKKIGCIGCCVINEFYTSSGHKGNDWSLLYVPEDTETGTPAPIEEDALLNGWQTLYYENY